MARDIEFSFSIIKSLITYGIKLGHGSKKIRLNDLNVCQWTASSTQLEEHLQSFDKGIFNSLQRAALVKEVVKKTQELNEHKLYKLKM